MLAVETCRAYAKENRASDMKRLMERMRMVGIVPCAATFLEALESFSLSSGSEENSTEIPAYDDDSDEDDDIYSIDALETSTFENSLSSD